MATRDLIIYVRVTDTESYPVNSTNDILSQNKYPIIYYSENPTAKLRPLKADGTPYALADFSSYDSWEFGIDNDWDTSTPPIIYSQSSTTAFTISEVTVGDTTYVQIAFLVDAFTATFETDIGTNKELRTNVYAELCAYNTGTTSPQLIIQFPFVLRNKLVDITSGIPAPVESNIYTRVQADATFEKITKKSSTTITDDTANYIYLGDTVLNRSVSFEGVAQDTSDNYNRISGYVTHDGTNATCYVSQDDMGGTLIATLTFTADISTANMRLIITAASVGENLTFMYDINNRIADSNYTFIPTDIYGIVAWWDVNQITDLSNLDDVTSWIDVTGVYTAGQSNALIKPVYKTNQINGLPAIDFEAANLEVLTTTLVPTAEQTAIIVFTCESLDDRVLLGSVDSGDGSFLGIETATDKLAGGVDTDGINTILGTTTIATDGTAYIGMLKYNGTTVNLALDGDIEYAAAQSGAVANAQGMYIGALNTNASAGSYWDGLIAEVIVYNTNISTTDSDKIITYLKNKYNIS